MRIQTFNTIAGIALALLLLGGGCSMFIKHAESERGLRDNALDACADVPGRDFEGCYAREFKRLHRERRQEMLGI